MSTTYFSWAFPVPGRELAVRDLSFDDFSPFLNTGVALNRTLMSASRNDWLNVILARLSSVVEAVRSSIAEYDPTHGPQGEEEGDGPVYLFAYLKCLLSLGRYARENELCLIHAKHEY